MPAPDRDPPYNISPLAFNPVKGIVGHYSDAEIDALLAALPTGGDSAITLHAGAVPDAGADTPNGLEEAFAALDDGLHYFKDVGTLVSITRQQYQTTITLTGQLSSFAKIVKSEAGLPTPQNPSLIVMQKPEGQCIKLTSDELDRPFGNPQMVDIFALGGGDPPTVDLSPYITQVDADARYGARTAEAVSLLQGQLQSVFDSVYTRPEADDRYAEKAKTYTKTECDGKFLTLVDIDQFAYRADVYTQKQCDDRFIRIDQAFSKVDFDNQMALMLYSRKQIDDRIAAINPLGSPSINNPALADFKQSVLDEVKLMLVGGTKTPPPDIDWTPIIRMDGSKETVSTEIQARMLGGFIELRGTLTFLAGTAEWNPLRLPPQFPLADLDANYPLAMRLVGSAVTYGFCSVSSKNRDIRVSPGARSNEAAFSGIRWKAAY